ncbi:FAD-dependent oxidoreductase [Wenxinia marina]|uniref:NADPH-glutathione reductase n=1 Tax=Wenxinia marina DSM 24838 TaxID=1123501 RepID=A0A0D0QBA0_9RHOB|nr:FAD-dependent oxidoreductase [Wenxinia marina]KIQ68178.1 NADPH-glutathione reductase [Wenxinia marina DSM 24838]GGL76549.1 glutathione-disulfide reductase [Wenxinia marina]
MAGYDYDLFVIGGGSGGVRAARVSAQLGAKVALAEESRMGGTCVIRGCVPKKLMVFASSFDGALEEARAYGWEVPDSRFEWPRFHDRLRAELDRLEGVYRKLLDSSGVTVFDQRATVSGPNEITLADGSTVSAAHILVATGGHPVRPDMKNARLGLVSDDIFHLEELPKSILIVGGGYIACEFACILAGMGVEVTQFYRGAQILRGFDDEARGLIAENMRARGIDLHVGTDIAEMTAASAERIDHGSGSDAVMGDDLLPGEGDPGCPVWVKATNGSERAYDALLFATGRAPNSKGLGLEEVGVEIGRRGEVKVDEYSATAVPSIHAIGDVTNRVNLTPVAIREGMAFARTVFGGERTPVDHDLIPSAVFTQPEFGTVGMTEEEAREDHAIEVYCNSFRPMRSAFAESKERVLMKLIVDAESRRVLGCHIVAPEAGEMIQLAGIAVKMGATKEDFDRTCAVHPTMAEELVTMREPTRTA